MGKVIAVVVAVVAVLIAFLIFNNAVLSWG